MKEIFWIVGNNFYKIPKSTTHDLSLVLSQLLQVALLEADTIIKALAGMVRYIGMEEMYADKEIIKKFVHFKMCSQSVIDEWPKWWGKEDLEDR